MRQTPQSHPGPRLISKLPIRCAAILLSGYLCLFPAVANAQLGPKDGADLTATEIERVKVGDTAPDFTLENIYGRNITLSEVYRNKKVVLVFYRGQW